MLSGVGALLFVAVIVAVSTVDGSDQIVMLDVGQGDAILVKSQGSSMLVDTGNQDARLLRELASKGMICLDAVLLTHADDDHCGSLDALQRAVRVNRIMVAEGMLECENEKARDLIEEAKACSREIIGLNAGDMFTVGKFTIRVVWPRTFNQDGGNADSICMLVDYDAESDGTVEFTTLMTGDAEKDEMGELIVSGAIGDIDVLKVGHHGSHNGLTGKQAQIIDPEIALVSCGKNNRYGHPDPETISILEDVGARVFRTDEDGQIRCTFDASGISVTTG